MRPHFMPGISFPGSCAMMDALLMACQNINDAGSFGGPWLCCESGARLDELAISETHTKRNHTRSSSVA